MKEDDDQCDHMAWRLEGSRSKPPRDPRDPYGIKVALGPTELVRYEISEC